MLLVPNSYTHTRTHAYTHTATNTHYVSPRITREWVTRMAPIAALSMEIHRASHTHMLYVSPEIERGVTKMAPIAALSLEIHIHTHTPFIFYSL